MRILEANSKMDFNGISKYLAIMRGGFCGPYWRLSGQKSQQSRMGKDAGNSKKVFLSWLVSIFCLTYFAAFGQAKTIAPVELPTQAGDMVKAQPCAACPAAVYIFVSESCPYVDHYQERIKNLVIKYEGKISFFLINSNPGQPAAGSPYFTKWNIAAPYLMDANQTAMTATGATKSPEAVVLKRNGSGLEIVYQGAIDDNPQVHHDTGINFLDDALQAVLSGSNPKVSAERVIGCVIRKK